MSDLTIQLLIGMVTAALGVLGKYYETKNRAQKNASDESSDEEAPSEDEDTYDDSESDEEYK